MRRSTSAAGMETERRCRNGALMRGLLVKEKLT